MEEKIGEENGEERNKKRKVEKSVEDKENAAVSETGFLGIIGGGVAVVGFLGVLSSLYNTEPNYDSLTNNDINKKEGTEGEDKDHLVKRTRSEESELAEATGMMEQTL